MSSDADKLRRIAELEQQIAEIKKQIFVHEERELFKKLNIDPYAPLPPDYGSIIMERYKQLYGNSNSGNSKGGKSKRNKKSKRRNSKKRL